MDRGRAKQRQQLLDRVLLYHEQTKHGSQSYARSLGRMDWATQPNPFRHYPGARLDLLPQSTLYSRTFGERSYDQVYLDSCPPEPLNRDTLSTFFYYSLALSAWKESGQSSWSLRVNPSSGNLHPTEAYLIAGPVSELTESPMVAHYDPYHHGWEERIHVSVAEWNQLSGELPNGSFLMGLTSIHWRESWKYGERAYRYCQLDLGHAFGCLQFAAMALGWELRAVESLSPSQIEVLCGVSAQKGIEKEEGACLLAVLPRGQFPLERQPVLRCGEGFFRTLNARVWKGVPNVLSPSHHEWPIIPFVCEAVENGEWTPEKESPFSNEPGMPMEACRGKDRSRTLAQVVRGRRSAVAMDGQTIFSADDFYRLLWRLQPRLNPTFFRRAAGEVHAALVLFVHRVSGVEPGLYVCCRSPSQRKALESCLRDDFEWSDPVGCPPELELYLLKRGDFQECSQTLSCHQSIAADGAFAVSILAEFREPLQDQGPGLYPRLFWEAGELGQMMYLEAEAAGLQATGIGCFLDDGVHELLGISDRSWQSLYHFTIGGGVKDERITTRSAYHHLMPRVLES